MFVAGHISICSLRTLAYWAEEARGRGGGVASSTSSTSHSLSQSRKYSRLAVLRSVPRVPRAEPRSATDMYRDLSLKTGTLRTMVAERRWDNHPS